MQASGSRRVSFLRSIIGIWLLSRLLRSRWFYFLVLVIIAASYGHSRYREFVLIPDDDSAFRVDNFSLAREGGQPSYQTDKDVELMHDLERMKNGRVFSLVAGRYYKVYRKRFHGARLLTQYVLVNENQYPEIHWMVKDACDLFGVEHVPRVFVGKGSGTDLIVTNYLDPVILISGDFVWAFKPEELRFLLATAVAHIKCEHVFFLDMIKGVQSILNAAIPDFLSELVLGGLGIKLMNWYREAQITADRGGLVVTGNVDVAVNALVKLNIGASVDDYYGNVNPGEYARQLEGIEDDPLSSAAAAMSELRNTNPFVTIRVRHLLKWYESNRVLFQ